MKTCLGMTVTVMMALMTGSVFAEEPETSKRFFIDKDGGGMEVRVNDPKDARKRDAVRQELRQAARDQSILSSPVMQEYGKEITYRYEQTDRGGRIRIKAKKSEARRAVQDFVRSQMSNASDAGDAAHKTVNFTFIRNTSLVAVPVMVNDHGPYQFLLDTGASNSILSAKVADSLRIPVKRSDTLFSAGGNLPVTLRILDTLQVGEASLKEVEIAVANFSLLQTLQVDGILGGDYLRRFKVSIDYNNQLVQIEPEPPESMSMLIA